MILVKGNYRCNTKLFLGIRDIQELVIKSMILIN